MAVEREHRSLRAMQCKNPGNEKSGIARLLGQDSLEAGKG